MEVFLKKLKSERGVFLMHRRMVSIRDSYYTLSFSPFMLTLYKEDILSLIKIAGSSSGKTSFQVGSYTLENEIKNSKDLEKLVKNDDFKQKEYHSFYIIVQSAAGLKEQPYFILDISPSSCNIYLSDTGDTELLKIYNDIKKIIEHRNNLRFFRKRIINFIIVICDIFLVLSIFFLKDIMEKALNKRFPDIIPILMLLLLNMIYIIPHGNNKIYLFERRDVKFLFKNRENIFLVGILAIIGIFIVISVVNLLKI